MEEIIVAVGVVALVLYLGRSSSTSAVNTMLPTQQVPGGQLPLYTPAPPVATGIAVGDAGAAVSGAYQTTLSPGGTGLPSFINRAIGRLSEAQPPPPPPPPFTYGGIAGTVGTAGIPLGGPLIPGVMPGTGTSFSIRAVSTGYTQPGEVIA